MLWLNFCFTSLHQFSFETNSVWFFFWLLLGFVVIINDEVNAGSCSDVCTEEDSSRFKSCYVLKSTHSKLYSCVDLLHICQRFSGSVRIIFAPVMNCETAGNSSIFS